MDQTAPELRNQITDDAILDATVWLRAWECEDGHPATRKPWALTPVCTLQAVAADLLRLRARFGRGR